MEETIDKIMDAIEAQFINCFFTENILQTIMDEVRSSILQSNSMLHPDDFSVESSQYDGIITIDIKLLTTDGDKRNWLANLGIPIILH